MAFVAEEHRGLLKVHQDPERLLDELLQHP